MEHHRPRWRQLDEDETIVDIRIDGYRKPEPTQAINGDKVQVVIQLPTRSHKGKANILMTPEIASQIGHDLIAAARDLNRSKQR